MDETRRLNAKLSTLCGNLYLLFPPVLYRVERCAVVLRRMVGGPAVRATKPLPGSARGE